MRAREARTTATATAAHGNSADATPQSLNTDSNEPTRELSTTTAVEERRTKLLGEIEDWKRKAASIEDAIAALEKRLAARKELVAQQEKIILEFRAKIKDIETMRDSGTLDDDQLQSVRKTIEQSRGALQYMERTTADHRRAIAQMQRDIDEDRRRVAVMRLQAVQMEWRLRNR